MTLRERLTGTAACLVIIALLAGMPAVLLGVGGNPIPNHLPTFHGLVGLLTTPDDGTAALTALAYAGWLLWIVLALLLLTEIAAQLRGVQTPDVPGLRLPQLAVRQLVAAAAALFLAAPLVLAHPTPSVAAPPGTAAPQNAGRREPQCPSPGVRWAEGRHAAVGRACRATRRHALRASRALPRRCRPLAGDLRRHPDRPAAPRQAPHRSRPDRRWLDGARSARREPTSPTRSDRWSSGTSVTATHCPSSRRPSSATPNRWPEIYRASEHLRQPDGARLQDPDLIRPGWTLRIPTGSTEQFPAVRGHQARCGACATPAGSSRSSEARRRPRRRTEPAPRPGCPDPLTDDRRHRGRPNPVR